MKKQVLTAIAIAASLCGYAQTKGTNAISFGVSVTTVKNDYNLPSGSSSNKQKDNSFNLGYGHFINDNTKLGIGLSYLHSTSTSTGGTQDNTTNGYGANISYQKYYPLIKRLYAYAGGIAGYSTSKLTYDDASLDRSYATDIYSAGAYGGLTWFVSKRWAFETRLLSATATYVTADQSDGSQGTGIYKNKTTDFNLNTEGFINDLGFTVYLMF